MFILMFILMRIHCVEVLRYSQIKSPLTLSFRELLISTIVVSTVAFCVSTLCFMVSDRRHDADDRRIIERFSSPHMNSHLKQMRWVLLFLILLSGGAAIYNGITAVTRTGISYNVFCVVKFFTLALLFWRYYSSILLFLENESSSNLDRMMERQIIAWIAIGFFSSIYAVSIMIF